MVLFIIDVDILGDKAIKGLAFALSLGIWEVRAEEDLEMGANYLRLERVQVVSGADCAAYFVSLPSP